jgi:MFS family permease
MTYPAWAELMAKAIPEQHWGKMMGITHMLGNGLSVIGGLIVMYVMGQWAYPSNYAALFLIAGGLHYISHCFLCLNREPVSRVSHEKHDNIRSYVKVLKTIITTDRSFLWFTVHQALGFSAIMGLGLFMVYAMKKFGVTDAQSGGFVLVSTATTLITSPLLGAAGDRYGHKSVIAIACIAYVASAICALLGRSLWIMYPVFALSAVSVSAQMIGFRNLVYELAPKERRPTYVALTSLLPAPFAVLFSLLGGWLAEHLASGFSIVFALSAILNIGSLAVLICLVHPRRAPEHGYYEEI